MKITNQKPAELTPNYVPAYAGAYDPMEHLARTVADPLMQPLIPGQPCTIDINGVTQNRRSLTDLFSSVTNVALDAVAENTAKDLLQSSLAAYHRHSTMAAASVFAVQSAAREKLPEPGPKVIYTPTADVNQVAKEFLSGKCSYDKYFASLAFYAKTNTLGFYFANKIAFEDFKQWLSTEVAAVAGNLPPETNTMFADFQNLRMDGLTESIIVRGSEADNNHDGSFARAIHHFLMSYLLTQAPNGFGNATFGILPFDLGELVCPLTIVMVNVEAHAHATAKQINDEWDDINQSIAMKPAIINHNTLQNLTATVKSMKRASASAAAAVAIQQAAKSANGRNAIIRFRTQPLTKVDITKYIMATLKKMKTVNRSMNVYRQTKMSFDRPNRRDPDNYNLMGKTVSTKYWPDLHVYMDTSGSISEENYEDAIRTCIQICRKLNIDLYFNSFSNVMSQCYKVNTKDRTLGTCYARFQRIPKVGGGTNFEQIWHYINANKKRQRELSLIITDFDWTAGRRYVKHPKNLYYLPCSHKDWDQIGRYAKRFAESMLHNEPNIRAHIYA